MKISVLGSVVSILLLAAVLMASPWHPGGEKFHELHPKDQKYLLSRKPQRPAATPAPKIGRISDDIKTTRVLQTRRPGRVEAVERRVSSADSRRGEVGSSLGRASIASTPGFKWDKRPRSSYVGTKRIASESKFVSPETAPWETVYSNSGAYSVQRTTQTLVLEDGTTATRVNMRSRKLGR